MVLNSAGPGENERMVLKVAAGLRSVQQQVNMGPDGGNFRVLTDNTLLFPEDLQTRLCDLSVGLFVEY